MVVSLSFLVALLFFSTCYSGACPSALTCNISFEIQWPFSFCNDFHTDPPCPGPIKIGCHGTDPVIYISGPESPNYWFQLKNISYTNSVLIVRDGDLSQLLRHSNCRNVTINFEPPIDDFNVEKYQKEHDGFSSIQCDPKTHNVQNDFCEEHNHNCLYPIEEMNSSVICSGSQSFSFEWTFSFHNPTGSLTLLSASIFSIDPSLLPDCGPQGEAPLPSKGSASEKKTIILVGILVGAGCFLVACCSCLLLCKRKKLRWVSSSLLLSERDSSDQYFHDLEMAGSESQCTQIFSYEELEEATDGFNPSKELGDGGFGAVYKGKLRDGRTVAVKRLYQNSYRRAEQFMNEVDILSRLHHRNLVSLYGCTARTSRDLLLVFEYVSNGTVADHLHGPRSFQKALTWPIRLSIAIETADALAYLHAVEPPIIHRDVKTNNILLDDGFHVKVGDFGLSRLFPLDVSHVSTVPQGTPGYVDPVYHQCYQLTDRSDVYSFGVVLVELISSKPAVDMSRSRDEINLANLALNKIQRSELDELVDPALGFQSNWEMRRMVSLVAELAFQCLQSDRDMRPSIKEVSEALKMIEKGDRNGNKLEKENPTKEEAHLLESDTILSPVTVMERWKSNNTTPDISA